MNVSLKDLKRNYGNLNVSFDLWKGESDAQPYIPQLIDDLVEKGLAYESQGALVVDIAEETDTKELPPVSSESLTELLFTRPLIWPPLSRESRITIQTAISTWWTSARSFTLPRCSAWLRRPAL